ncbi:TY-Chap domain-containing protein [Gordonia paraffinivorans]|uniref:TY-Chap domain-containing protein n=1 Tax=Gordonia paraffinivorans TaxID=175628 RepID=UPI001C92C88D|nr:hypothetical protein [Gordonia paraffinivorans]
MTGSNRLRCTIENTALRWQSPQQWSANVSTLRALGWRRLERKSVHVVEAGRRRAAELATTATRALVEVFGYADPSALEIHDPFGPGKTGTPPRRGVRRRGNPAPASGPRCRRTALARRHRRRGMHLPRRVLVTDTHHLRALMQD